MEAWRTQTKIFLLNPSVTVANQRPGAQGKNSQRKPTPPPGNIFFK